MSDKPKPRGRPKLYGQEDTTAQTITFRVVDWERYRLAAMRLGITRAELVRDALEKHLTSLEKEPKP